MTRAWNKKTSVTATGGLLLCGLGALLVATRSNGPLLPQAWAYWDNPRLLFPENPTDFGHVRGFTTPIPAAKGDSSVQPNISTTVLTPQLKELPASTDSAKPERPKTWKQQATLKTGVWFPAPYLPYGGDLIRIGPLPSSSDFYRIRIKNGDLEGTLAAPTLEAGKLWAQFPINGGVPCDNPHHLPLEVSLKEGADLTVTIEKLR